MEKINPTFSRGDVRWYEEDEPFLALFRLGGRAKKVKKQTKEVNKWGAGIVTGCVHSNQRRILHRAFITSAHGLIDKKHNHNIFLFSPCIVFFAKYFSR